jgi:hypothetical protein
LLVYLRSRFVLNVCKKHLRMRSVNKRGLEGWARLEGMRLSWRLVRRRNEGYS